MKNDKDIEKLWGKLSSEMENDSSLKEDAIRKDVSGRSQGITSKIYQFLNLGIWSNIIVFALNMIALIFVYSENPLIIYAASATLISLSIAAHLFYMRFQLSSMKMQDLDLRSLLVQKINFFNQHLILARYEVSLGIIFFIFTLNLLVDYLEAKQFVGNSVRYAVVLAAAFLLLSFYFSIVHRSYLRQLKTALSDLDQESLTNLDQDMAKVKLVRILFSILIVLILLLGVLTLFLV